MNLIGFFSVVAGAGMGVTENSEFMKITVKIKNTARIGYTTLGIADVIAKSGNDEIPIPNLLLSLIVSEPLSGSTNNNIVNIVNNNITTNNVVPNNVVNNTPNSVDKDVPKTGIEDYFMPAIIIISIIGIAALIRYKKIGQI